jgi:5-methylcytosine-specific restriction endonuclease McrA
MVNNPKNYQANRAAGVAALGGKCAKCGTTDALEVDHVNPATKTRQTYTLWFLSPDNPDFIAELAKCQLLCTDCHREKTGQENRVRVHGTYSMYQRGKCRCEACVAVMSEARKRSRRKN